MNKNTKTISFYNSVTKQLEEKELTNKPIKWYVCGPTVYDDAHLGHARTYIMNDLMVKTIKYFGNDVFHIMNITDIDNKILDRAIINYKDVNKHTELTEKYTKRFLEDLTRLGVDIPDSIPKVTLHMNMIIEFIINMVDNGYAYVELENKDDKDVNRKGKSIYFDTTEYNKKNKSYVFNNAKNQDEVENKHIKYKKNSKDFALWKGVYDNEIGWISPWGNGRPGWHTECAAFINSHKGIDVHTGGVDLCFPHHENEVKQLIASGINCSSFIHIGHLHIDGLKMAKSLKNFTTVRNFLEDDDGRKVIQLRYMFLQHNYRDTMEYSTVHFEQAKRQLHLLQNIVETIKISIDKNIHEVECYNDNLNDNVTEFYDRILTHLHNDFKFYLVIKELHDYGGFIFDYLNKTKIVNISYLKSIKNIYDKIMNLLGISYHNDNKNGEGEMVSLITKIRDEIRNQAKLTKNKDLWKLSDVIRNDILKPLGYQLEDKPDEATVWKHV
jgi:cysteinyl-tRNA synthetase